jgi:type IV pilus assembly protein PilA
MFQRFHEMKERREGGFTLIELLVVIIIIAILAAIAIPVFLRQREKGWRAQTQSGLKNAATAMESYATENNGDYGGVTGAPSTAALEPGGADDQGLNLPPDVTVTIASADASGFCLNGVNANLAGETWSYDSDVGEPVSGAC